jgi:hypothetical protein
VDEIEAGKKEPGATRDGGDGRTTHDNDLATDEEKWKRKIEQHI